MKYIITILSTILFISFAGAQNIVPNYSFEQYDSCQFTLNVSAYEYSLNCISWGQATSDPVQYYNACDTAAASLGGFYPWVGVPNNVQGNQNAYEGVGYTGIGVYDSVEPEFKQYLITNIPELDVDTAYQVTIHISLADSSRFATDGMGVFFTTYGSPNLGTLGTLIESPQIDYTSYGIISDTANWTTLTSTFVADSAYTSLIIGIFKPASEMNIFGFNSHAHKIAYYYVDAVVVEKLSSTGIKSINSNDGAKIYPNPFTDHATLLFSNPYNLPHSLSLYNAEGQIMLRQDNITSGKTRIDKDNLPSGFYYYQLTNADNIVANGKVIIN